MRYHSFVFAVMVAAAASCSYANAPGSSAAVDLTFGIQRLATEPAFLILHGAQGLIVRGFYETPTSGYTAKASAGIAGRTLELRVIGKQPANNFPMISATGYEAVVRGLTAGPLHLRVIHEWSGANRSPLVAFEHDVEVE